MAKEFSLKALEKAKKQSFEKVDTQPIFMPVGYTRPETLNQALERILAHSAAQGLSLQEAYNMLTGEFDEEGNESLPNFDGAFPLMQEDDDGFEQSPFAEYDPLPAPPPPVEAPAKQDEQSQQAAPDPTPSPGADPKPE